MSKHQRQRKKDEATVVKVKRRSKRKFGSSHRLIAGGMVQEIEGYQKVVAKHEGIKGKCLLVSFNPRME